MVNCTIISLELKIFYKKEYMQGGEIMRKLKYLSAALLTSLMVLMGGNSLSYGESSVDQLIIINSARNTLNFYEKGSRTLFHEAKW